MAYQIRVVAPDGKLSTGHLLTIKRSLDNEGVNLSGIEIEWAENGMDEEFRMIWARISREIGSVNLMIFLIYDEGRQFQSLSLYNGGIKGASHKSFDYEVNGVGIHINLFKGLELDYDITERLEQIQVSNDQEVIDLPKGDYRVVAPEMLRILPNVTLSKVWQNGSVAVYRYSAPGTLAIVKIDQAPNITGRYGDLPERLSLRAALSYFAWYLYRQVDDEAIYYRNNPPKILA